MLNRLADDGAAAWQEDRHAQRRGIGDFPREWFKIVPAVLAAKDDDTHTRSERFECGNGCFGRCRDRVVHPFDAVYDGDGFQTVRESLK